MDRIKNLQKPDFVEKKTSKSIKSETRFLVNSRTQVEVLPKKKAGNILELYICLQKWYEQVMSKYLSDTKVLLVITFTDLHLTIAFHDLIA